ncbi:MAG TPA: hypothetical protein VKB80_26070 [Kofleriaceae bacterium]|nr:hypothetical protein [Kofleriaceae bacterium]
MSQSLLFIPLHLLGIALCFACGPRRRPALCCALGFPVGLAAAVVLALAMMMVRIRHDRWTLGAAMAIAGLAAAFGAARRGMGRRDLAIAGAWTAAFAAMCAAISPFNVAILTSIDSHRILSLAIAIANDGGLEPATMARLGHWGVFQVVAHSMMGLTRQDFLYSLPLALGLSFIPVFAVLLWHALESLGAAPRRRWLLVGLVTAALFTIGALDYHILYIHTNLGAGVYLFLFLVMFWIAEVERDASWLPVAFLALVAFALHRTETPIVAVLVLSLTVTRSELPRRPIGFALAGSSAGMILWLEVLAAHLSPEGDFLTPGRCHLMAGLLAGFFLWWAASARSEIIRCIDRRMPLLISATCALALAGELASRPDHMIASARSWAFNLTTLPLWGQTWFIILALVVIGLAVAPPPFRAPFAVGLPACFAVVLFLVYFRAPYREGRGDSANRMTIQMLPLIVFYLAIKFIPALDCRTRDSQRRSATAAEIGSPVRTSIQRN